MKNKILLCGLIIVIMALIVVFGYTNARYYSTASMTGDLDYAKTIGKISIHHPEWVGGYTGPDNGSGVFEITQVPMEYANIHYEVTNKVDDEINEQEVSYYIRIVAEDGSNNIPIEYNVHEYNNPNGVLDLEEGVGYGPFTLSADTEEKEKYSIKVNWKSEDIKYLNDVQHLKVQMVKKRGDGTLKIIDEAPLNMEYKGSKVKVTFNYYLYGTSVSIGTSQTLNMMDDFTIDFKDSNQLNELGITLPSDYTFHDVRHNINNAGEYSGTATSVVIPKGYCLSGYFVEVYLTSSTKVAVQLAYYDYTDYETDENGNRTYKEISGNVQTLVIPRGTTIDFTNETQREELKIKLPTGYTLKGLDGKLINHKYTDTSVTIPNTDVDDSHFIDVYMIPSGTTTVNLSYYDSSVDTSKLISEQNSLSVPVGTKIDFTDSSILTSLGITLPSGYEFKTAYCTDIDNTGAGHNAITIPYGGAGITYNINVVLDKIVTIITVPVKFYNSSGVEVSSTTVDMKNDGTYDFTTDECRSLCPNLKTMTSFTIYIANKWGSTTEVANTTSGKVNIDYNATYGSSFKLTDEGSYIYIKAWW